MWGRDRIYMDTNSMTAGTEPTEESLRARRRMLAQQAITLAMQARWEEAVEVNREIVQIEPDDAEGHNRLGKALTELGRVGEARDAYESALRADPANLIAQRNLDRLSKISEAEAAELAKKAA